jgi:hypothetical protein
MIVDINGNEIAKYALQDRNLYWPIVLVLDDLVADKKVLLVSTPATLEEIYQAVVILKADCVLIENCSHACYIHVEDIPTSLPVPLYHLSSNMEYFYTATEHVLFFPCWLFAAKTFPANNLIIGSEADINRKFNISCTNRNLKYRLHRIYWLGKLLQKPYVNDICRRMYKYDDFDFNYEEYNAGLTYEEWKIIKEHYDNSPGFIDLEINAVVDTNFDIYTDSYINFLCETYVEYNFLSEKSFKPLMAGQIPMIFGCPGIVKMYADLGFDMFYDIIDHNVYDSITDRDQRAQAMVDYLDHVHRLPFSDIFRKTVERRRKNLEYMYSDKLLQMITDPIVKKIRGLV